MDLIDFQPILHSQHTTPSIAWGLEKIFTLFKQAIQFLIFKIAYYVGTLFSDEVHYVQINTLSGFPQGGNTCYLAAVLQALRATKVFEHYLNTNLPEHKSVVQERIKNLFYKKCPTGRDLDAIRDALNKYSIKVRKKPLFSDHGQEDAQEFLSALFDILEVPNSKFHLTCLHEKPYCFALRSLFEQELRQNLKQKVNEPDEQFRRRISLQNQLQNLFSETDRSSIIDSKIFNTLQLHAPQYLSKKDWYRVDKWINVLISDLDFSQSAYKTFYHIFQEVPDEEQEGAPQEHNMLVLNLPPNAKPAKLDDILFYDQGSKETSICTYKDGKLLPLPPGNQSLTITEFEVPFDENNQPMTKHLPKILPICLARFGWDDQLQKPNQSIIPSRKIAFPIKGSTSHALFELRSAVVHLGAKSGHYLAFVRHKGLWCRCDDSVVTKSNWDAVTQRCRSNGYLYFYQFKGLS